MDNKLTGRIYDIQKFSIHDGPGIRTEVFLMGCPLKCLWCHSPESQSIDKQLGWFEIRCIGVKNCGICIKTCLAGAIKKGKIKYIAVQKSEVELIDIDRNICSNCGKCAEACTAQALSMAGRDVTVEEVMAIIEKDTAFYRKSGGGVTISGGEALVQHDFTLALAKECKDRGLHVCLDTTGFAKWEICKEILPFVDIVLYDLKHMNSEKHRELTGVPNELILENARKMAAEKAVFQIRIPIIPGLTDSEENLRNTSKFCLELGSSVQLIQILPYHRLGIVKYERLHKKYELEEIKPPTDEHMEHCKGIIESYGLKVKIH
jgi:pyruvate formate lyase activating enzyme